MIDHITVHLSEVALHSAALDSLMAELGFREIDAAEEIKAGWDVRWFIHHQPGYQAFSFTQAPQVPARKPELHLVADDNWSPRPQPALSHFCIVGVGDPLFEMCRRSEWNEHDNPNSQTYRRTWLNYFGLRIEVRP